MNRRVMFYQNPPDGCTYYRTQLPHRFLSYFNKQISITTKLPPTDSLQNFSDMLNYDTFVFQRIMLPQFHETIFPLFRRNRKKIVFDIDDLLWDIPMYNNAFCFYSTKVLSDLSANIRNSDVITVSTQPLADYISTTFNKPTVVIPNYLDSSYSYRPTNNERIKIGWCGSPSHFGDFSDELVDYLKELIDSYRIEFTVFGELPDVFLDTPNIRHVRWCDMGSYHRTLSSLQLDIGLIVCKDNHFNKCKSNIKFLEYSSASICTIADNIYPYVNTIVEGETGLLVKEQSDWKKHIEYLITNPSEIQRIAKNANTYVASKHTLTSDAANYMKLWESVL